MEYFVDRMEANIAVCETSDGEIVHVPLDILPSETKEGSVLREEAGVYCLDDAAAAARRAALFALQESLFETEDDA